MAPLFIATAVGPFIFEAPVFFIVAAPVHFLVTALTTSNPV
jgi:hypothetical protein